MIFSDEAYSKLMLGEGSGLVVDEDSDYILELPDWVDKEKLKM